MNLTIEECVKLANKQFGKNPLIEEKKMTPIFKVIDRKTKKEFSKKKSMILAGFDKRTKAGDYLIMEDGSLYIDDKCGNIKPINSKDVEIDIIWDFSEEIEMEGRLK